MDHNTLLWELYEAVQPALLLLIDALIAALIGYLLMKLPAPIRAYVEAKHRAALHSALRTGAARVLEGDFDAEAAVSEIVAYARRSVPDAMKHLSPSADILRDLALAKLGELRGAPRSP